jgi:HK97 family phage major capsid protein
MAEDDLAAQVRAQLTSLDTFMTEVRGDLTTLKDRIDKVRQQALSRGVGGPITLAATGDSIGALVAGSNEVKTFMSSGLRGAAVVRVPGRLIRKSVITIVPDLATGVQTDLPAPLPVPPLALTNLIPSVLLTEGAFQFLRQLPPRPVAGVQVNEGDVKTEAAFKFQPVTLTPETLAVWVPCSNQAAMDVAGLTQLIESDLLTAIRVLEENEILSGDGTTGHLTGLLPVATPVNTTGATTIDAVAALVGSLTAQGVAVTGVVMNPNDWLDMTLLKSTGSGDYLLGSPTQAPPQVLWGVGLALSSAMPAGTVLAGDFTRGCVLRYREEANVQISTEHADFFVRNLLALRAEERVLLAVRQPTSFAKTTLGAR